MTSGEAAVTMQYLTFTLDNEMFALEITKVREVLEFTSMTKVPRTPDFMRGVINLRGSVVPVIDLRLRFGMPKTEKSIHTSIIIVEVFLEDEILVLGVMVDSVQEVFDLNSDQIEPPPQIGIRMKTEFLKGMGKRDDHFIMILDIDRVLSEEELAVVQETGSDVSDEEPTDK